MTARDDFDRLLSALFVADAPQREPEHLLGQVLAQTARTRRRPAWLIPERWIPMSTLTSAAAAVPRAPWRIVGLAALLILALAVGAVLIAGNQQSRELPAPFGPAANGLVAYAADGDIYTVDPVTGTSKAIVTGVPTDHDPVWSPNGTRLAFIRDLEGGDQRLYTAGADGGYLQAITPEPQSNISSVGFSPDGREVMFVSGIGPFTEIRLAKADGSGMRTLDVGTPASQPVFRPPDGAQILFESSAGEGGIYVVNTDGSGLRTLVEPDRTANSGGASWSPDGSLIAYGQYDMTVPVWTTHTRIMSADGSGDRALPAPPDAKWNGGAAWSNDGTRLVILRGYSPAGTEDVVAAVVPVDGSGTGVESDHFAGWPTFAWAPDDTSIIVMPADGIGHSQLMDPRTGETQTAGWASTGSPSWQRRVR